MRKIKTKIPPQLYILLTFFSVIVIGTILLVLPFSTTDGKGLSFIEALFTATSATCVTGLSVINCAELSLFGRVILALLIEVGGLSFLTIATFIFSLFSKLTVGSYKLMSEALNNDHPGEAMRLIKRILLFSFIIQSAGAVVNALIFRFQFQMDPASSIGYGLFHSISSFNNAGLDIFGANSLLDYAGNVWLNVNTMILIILGGIGFVVLEDIVFKRKWRRFSLTSKIALTMTAFLLIGGTLLLKLSLGDSITWLQAAFQSVTARTAGFSTFDMADLNASSYLVMIILMFIGASPASTGGGLKTTTFFIILLLIYRFVRKETPTVFRRRIPKKVIDKALIIFTVEIFYVMMITFILTFVERDIAFQGLLFEVISAFATVGLSMGVTGELSLAGQIIIIVTMFFGRLGPLTILSLGNSRKNEIKDKEIRFIEEKVIVG